MLNTMINTVGNDMMMHQTVYHTFDITSGNLTLTDGLIILGGVVVITGIFFLLLKVFDII